MRVGGKIEVFTRRSVTGWLAVFGQPDERPRLELLLDGVVLATAAADEYRADVAAKELGDGRCQFRIALPTPLTDEEAARLRLRLVGSEMFLELPRPTPRPLAPAAPAPAGLASPVFVVGSPRSGTSIMTRALAAAGYHGFEEGNLLGMSQMVDRQVDLYYATNDATAADTLLGNVHQEALKARLFTVFKDTLDRLNPLDPWFDKTGNPETILILPRVMAAWPDSRVIFAKRRGIENVLSRVTKFPERDFAYHCEDWAANMRAWRTTSDQLDPSRITEVDQREMLEAPTAVGARLAALLRMPAEARAALDRTFRVERPQESFPGSAERVINLADTGWSEEQMATFSRLCGPTMRMFGYGDGA